MSEIQAEPADVRSDVLDTPEAGGLVVRGGVIRIIGFGLSILCSLGGVVLVTRYLGTELYGRFQTVLNLLLVVQAVTDVGMGTLGVREFAQRRGADRDRMLRVLLGLRTALTLLGVGIAVIVAIAAGYDRTLVAGTLAGGFGLVLTVIQTTLAIPLSAELRIRAVTALDVARAAGVAAVYALLVLAGAGVLPFLAATVPVQLALVVCTALLVRRRVPLMPTIDLRAWAGLLAVSVSFALAVAVGTIYQYIAQILTSFVSTPHEAGLFAAAFRTYMVVAAVPGVLVSTAFPLLSRAARDDHDRLVYGLRKLTDAMTLVGVAAALTLVVGAPAIIEVIAGPEFAGAVPALRVEGIAMLMAFGITTWGFGLMSVHAHGAMVVANGCALIVSTGTVLLLAPAHGALGAAWATVAGESVLAVLYFLSLVRARHGLRPHLRVAALGLASGLVACAAAFASGWSAVPATALALAIYLTLVVLVRAIPQELVDVLPGGLRTRIQGSD